MMKDFSLVFKFNHSKANIRYFYVIYSYVNIVMESSNVFLYSSEDVLTFSNLNYGE